LTLGKQRYTKSDTPTEGLSNRTIGIEVVYLAITDASKKWTMPIHNWKPALNRFTIVFGERVTAYL